MPWGWLAAAFAAAAGLGYLYFSFPRTAGNTGPVIHFSIAAPEGTAIDDFAVSPDGRTLAFTATGYDGRATLWIRSFETPEGRELAGTEGAKAPFWSPDSRRLGFFADGKLKRIDLGGVPPLTLAEAPDPRGGVWSSRGFIVFAAGDGSLSRIAASGGAVEPLTGGSEEDDLQWPSLLPDEDGILVHRQPAGEIHAVRFDGEMRSLAAAEAAVFSDGHLLFVRAGTLLAQPLDPDDVELSGPPLAIARANTVSSGDTRAPGLSAGGGVLAFRNSGPAAPRRLRWFDRAGLIGDEVGGAELEGGFALSPDGTKVAFTRDSDLWVSDVARGSATRLTFDRPGPSSVRWSPDGRKVAFVASANGHRRILLLNADGSGNPEMLVELPGTVTLDDWSPDGKILIYTHHGRQSGRGLWLMPLSGDRKPALVLNNAPGAGRVQQGRLSPDGRWLAYVSNETGRDEVYVQSLPTGNGKWMISYEGGSQPVWRRDGRELYYIRNRRQLMAVAIGGNAALEAGRPVALFEVPVEASFEVTPDGRRFLIAATERQPEPEPVQILVNWLSAIQP
jgi:Tol biopolymer transport system component